MRIPDHALTKAELALRHATTERAVAIIPKARYEKWKPKTLSGYASIAKTMENYGRSRGEMFMGAAMGMTQAQVACYYIDRVDEGEGVAPSTADRELGVAIKWWEEFVSSFPEAKHLPHPIKNTLIEDLKKRAKLKYQKAAEPKTGFTIEELTAYWADGTITGSWIYDHSRLCVGIMWFFLARSIAAGHIVFRGRHEGPIANADSDVNWGSNAQHGRYMWVEIERDKTLRDKQHSNRFVPFDNGSHIALAQYARDYIKHYKMPSGTYLLAARDHDGTFHDTPFTNWSRVISHVCSKLGLDRTLYGTQSCRRGCAQWLNACGLDYDQIGLLGFWLSSVVRRYTMVQSTPRLLAWQGTARR